MTGRLLIPVTKQKQVWGGLGMVLDTVDIPN